MLQTITKLYVHCTENNTYTPRVPLSSSKLVSCSAGEGRERQQGGEAELCRAAKSTSFTMAPARRFWHFITSQKGTTSRHRGRGRAGTGRETGEGQPWAEAMTHLAQRQQEQEQQRQRRLPDRLSCLFPRGICVLLPACFLSLSPSVAVSLLLLSFGFSRFSTWLWTRK